MHKVRTIAFFVVALAGLTGCATPDIVRLADGSLVYRIDCAGSASGLNYCYGRAGKTCGAEGFSVVDETGRVLSIGGGSTTTQDEQVMLHAADKNSLLVKCGS
jgi:hypothetical protein